MATGDELEGWAFLVARGRLRGWSSLLVPDFLADANEIGILTEKVSGDVSPSGPPRIVGINAVRSGELTVTYRSHRLTSFDIDDAPQPTDDPVTDQHGRPLDLLYGIVTREPVSEPSEEDLVAVKEEAMAAYQSFLKDESAFAVMRSHRHSLRSQPGHPVWGDTLTPAAAIPVTALGNPSLTVPPDRSGKRSVPLSRKSWILPLLVVLLVGSVGYQLIARPSHTGPITTSSPSSCGDVEPGASVICIVSLKFTGPTATEVSNVVVNPSGLEATWTARPDCQGTFTAGQICRQTVDVTIAAAAPPGKTFTSQLVVTHTAAKGSSRFPLSVTIRATR